MENNNLLFHHGPQGYVDLLEGRSINSIVEIEMEKVKGYLPKGLHPFEPRPGIAQLLISVIVFEDGAFGVLEKFYEPHVCIMVNSDLRLSLPGKGIMPPKMPMFALNVTSTSKDFLKHARMIDRMPVSFYEDIRVEEHQNEAAFTMYDGSRMVLDMRNTDPAFSDDHFYPVEELYVQCFSAVDDALYHLPAAVSGWVYEHQKPGIMTIDPDHPFFCGLDLPTEVPVAYQAIAKPGHFTSRFFSPEKVRAL